MAWVANCQVQRKTITISITRQSNYYDFVKHQAAYSSMKRSLSNLVIATFACISAVFVSPNSAFAEGSKTDLDCTEVNPDSPYYCGEEEPVSEPDVNLPLLNDLITSVAEDAVNSTVVTNLNDANTGNDTDLDGQALSYSITAGNTDGIFAIDTNTGEITIADNSNLDYETTQQYVLTAQASDGANTDSAAVTIDIINVDEVVETTEPDILVLFSLSWTTPITRTDGTVLAPTDIGGYRIYYGNTPDDMTQHVDLKDGLATDYLITDLTQGGYYFGVTAYDVDGLESSFSEIVYKEKF